MDPLIDLIQLLRPKATLWRQIEASGRWAVSFPKRDDLLFCSVVYGNCLIVRPNMEPVKMSPGDFVLIRTSVPFRFSSNTSVKPVDSVKLFGASSSGLVKLGIDEGHPVLLRGGRFLFDTANENLLTALMPPLVHIVATANRSERIRMLLHMNASEAAASEPGRDFVVARLMELLFVDILRDPYLRAEDGDTGLLAGLADPITARALQTMHGNMGRNWTVAELAKQRGVSRSRFAARFRNTVGVSPIRYLLDWRITLAKDELRKGARSISEIAFAVGFQSISAFSTAFSRTVGCPPKQYAKNRQR
ncbi:AraC family transcriptional regulator [Terriglobus sp.]|uniref:AraC family transcriptional regulator n=1 Tax=Terriglobus sp. TaxID=1889013 RepID=UPI003B002745